MLLISNNQARVYLVPEEVLTGEPAESLLRLQTSLEVLRLFRSTYEDHRANLRKYQKNGIMVRRWDFSPTLVFSRLDQFISTLENIKVNTAGHSKMKKQQNLISGTYLTNEILMLMFDCDVLPCVASSQDILSTYLDLMKLEKLEIGGVRGRALSLQIQSLYQEFLDSYRVFTEKPYDCLDGTNMVCITAVDCGTLSMPAGKLEGCVSIATLWSTYLFENSEASPE